MKRLIPSVLLYLIVSTGFCFAQTRQDEFSQHGKATQEMQQIDGLYAAHPSFPIGAKVIVRNKNTNIAVEVTITGRILASSERIIDLSADAASALGIDNEGEVTVVASSVYYQQYLLSSAPPETPAEAEDAWVPRQSSPVAPEPLTSEPESSDIAEYNRWLDIMILESLETIEKANTLDQREILEELHDTDYLADTQLAQPLPEPIAPTLHTPQQKNKIRIIPGLPDPNSGKVYHLQVGAFSIEKSACEVYQMISSAGFEAVQEQYGSFHRVYAAGVPAAAVHFAVNRLEAMGITEVWIRE